MTGQLILYRTRSLRPSQRYAWRLVASNGRTVATSGEGYADAGVAADMAARVVGGDFNDVLTVDLTGRA